MPSRGGGSITVMSCISMVSPDPPPTPTSLEYMGPGGRGNYREGSVRPTGRGVSSRGLLVDGGLHGIYYSGRPCNPSHRLLLTGKCVPGEGRGYKGWYLQCKGY